MIENLYDKHDILELAHGRWLSILASLCPELEPALKRPGRHVPGPVHGGKDGFRLFPDVAQTGGGICNSCGAKAGGFALLMWLKGWTFRQALEAVGDVLGAERTVERHKQRTFGPGEAVKRSDAHAVDACAVDARAVDARAVDALAAHDRALGLWRNSLPLLAGKSKPLHRYLTRRGLNVAICDFSQIRSLRFCERLAFYDQTGKRAGLYPAMLAALSRPDGDIVTLHRTYLDCDGTKAPVRNPKKLTPGGGVNGCAVHLGPATGGVVNIAEGLETALSIYRAMAMSVWATTTAALMAGVAIPDHVHSVAIWADRDRNRTGQRAAFALKARCKAQGKHAFVMLPKQPISGNAKGIDWNDVWLEYGREGFPPRREFRNFIAEKARNALVVIDGAKRSVA